MIAFLFILLSILGFSWAALDYSPYFLAAMFVCALMILKEIFSSERGEEDET